MESLAIKTPTPGYVRGKSSPEKRSNDAGNTHHPRVAPPKSVYLAINQIGQGAHSPRNPMYFGRSFRGTIEVRMITFPTWTPAAAKPAMALPMMKAVELGAAAHKAEPTSNTNMLARNAYFGVVKVYTLPISS